MGDRPILRLLARQDKTTQKDVKYARATSGISTRYQNVPAATVIPVL